MRVAAAAAVALASIRVAAAAPVAGNQTIFDLKGLLGQQSGQ
jgi:hypothetical protein